MTSQYTRFYAQSQPKLGLEKELNALHNLIQGNPPKGISSAKHLLPNALRSLYEQEQQLWPTDLH